MQYIYTIFHCSICMSNSSSLLFSSELCLADRSLIKKAPNPINSASTDLNINKLSDHKITKLLGQQNYVT